MNQPETGPSSGAARRIVLAVNPAAAFGHHRRRRESAGHQAARYFRAAGWDVVELQADSYRSLRQQVDECLAGPDGTAALVVVGGDGMVNLGVNALAGLDVPLGIVPSGTGNDVARMLGLPLDHVAGACARIEAALVGGGRKIDVGMVTCEGVDTRFAGVLSAGFDAAVNERANTWRWPKGKNRYNLAMLRELVSFPRIHYTVTADGREWRQPAILISVANGQSIGGGMKITPDALPDDGWLDLFVVEPLSRLRFLAVFPKVFAGKHTGHPAVRISRVRAVRLEADGVVAYADGERVGPLPIVVQAVPDSLRVLC
ncbi:diacylglycerol/lipid kinase family protein [Paenarthrobacter ilicis]|uniref:diacylglycerol/lipid kinase family protein n=1 Tax=Paenarthrobacter ilicis TaxID=43665 RepID=UPI003869A9B7